MILSYKACPFCNAIGVGDLGLCLDLKGSVRYGPFKLDDFLELLALEDHAHRHLVRLQLAVDLWVVGRVLAELAVRKGLQLDRVLTRRVEGEPHVREGVPQGAAPPTASVTASSPCSSSAAAALAPPVRCAVALVPAAVHVRGVPYDRPSAVVA